MPVTIEARGMVASGFEAVRETFEAGVGDLGDGGGALAAYVDGEPVVDLWAGSARPGSAWQADTLATIFSTTKALATLCVQILVDRGQIGLDTRIVEVWPEFGANGKERIRLRHVLSHTAGVLAPVDVANILSWQGDGWQAYERIAAGLAAARPAVTIGATFAYQALTFGWLLGEVVRRLTGESIGAFFRREVAEPLGLDIWIGTPPDVQPRVATLIPAPVPEGPARDIARDPSTLSGQAFLALRDGDFLDHLAVVNVPSFQEAEIAAVNGTATARSLARLFAVLAQGGVLDGVRLVSEDSIRMFRTLQIHAPNALEVEADPPGDTVELHMRMLGYHGSSKPYRLPRRLGPSDTAFGHDGAGGQAGFADPEAHLAVGFVRSHFTFNTSFSGRLFDVLYGCLG
jgi:CubicO group peptidase (beta-lactamase class C family)